MDRVYESGAVAGAPAAPAAPSTGYPTNGNPVGGIEATWPGAYWFYMITEELRAVITAAGLVPDHTNLGQLLAALQGGFGLGKLLADSGYVALPGGVIIQWGTGSAAAASGVGSSDTSIPNIFPVAFPNTCLKILATHRGGDETVNIIITSSTPTQFTAETNNLGLVSAEYIAIGY